MNIEFSLPAANLPKFLSMSLARGMSPLGTKNQNFGRPAELNKMV